MTEWETTSTELREPPIRNLRVRAARGTIVNSAFQVGLALLGLLRHLAVAAFLTREEFGLWGILLATLVTLVWLKQVGIADKYIQQREPDQELAFQKAFTLELALSCAYFVLCCAAVPVFAIAYGHSEIVAPGIVLAAGVILTAFQTPAWIYYRRLAYAKQRTLTSVDPVVSIIAMVALGAAGYGYWGLVVGSLIGNVSGALVCVATSPYRLRLRFDKSTLHEYVRFSGPLLALGLSRLVVVNGAFLTVNRAVGLAAVAAVGLANTYANFSDRVNAIVSQTLYPAVCRVADRRDALVEVFIKSNRVALMWGLPFGGGLALFSADLVHFVIGEKWESAIGLLAVFGVIAGFGQLAFNWSIFMRAMNRTGPLLVAALFNVGVLVTAMVPLTLLFGLTGYAIGAAVSTIVQVAVRSYYMGRLFEGFNLIRHTIRAVTPAVPPVALVLAIRAIAGGDRSPSRAIAELVLYVLATVACTYLFERRLITEIIGYLRGRTKSSAPAPSQASVATGSAP